jgi:hypothetical protein
LPQINQQTGSETDDLEKIDLKRIYKSNSYKNLRKDYIENKRGSGILDTGDNPALAHLQKIRVDRRYPRPPPDYLDEIREKRLEKEAS